MATKNKKKTKIDVNEKFQEYQTFIVEHPNYKGMPDTFNENEKIQWEAPSNRASGNFQFTHDKRYKWWKKKAQELGIDPNTNKWISKAAKKNHPTKLHPCKKCGNIMDIRYCYLGATLIKRINDLNFYNGELELNNTMHIVEFITKFTDEFNQKAFEALPNLLKCKQVNQIPNLDYNIDTWIKWIEENYIPIEPSLLSPGVMSNAPDRLDGFHSFNRCCRSSADKGRTKENLSLYSTDRRAFELWTDGNWITANKLMAKVSADKKIQSNSCANTEKQDSENHTNVITADHIGPISLGFSHREEFQLLCNSCNSSKNNRMYFSDVQQLISKEKEGIDVTSWYAKEVWNLCKDKVSDAESALRLSRVMRDNRNIALELINYFYINGFPLFLLTLLNLHFADYTYEITKYNISDSKIITAEFLSKPSKLQYVSNQKSRKIRIAFEALTTYSQKDNRNAYSISNDSIESLKETAISILKAQDNYLIRKNEDLKLIVSSDYSTLKDFIEELDWNKVTNEISFIKVRSIMVEIMKQVGTLLANDWDSPRYSREIE